MERISFQEAMKNLGDRDLFAAECISVTLEMIETVYKRELTEDEKLIAFTMFNSGMMLESFSSPPIPEKMSFTMN